MFRCPPAEQSEEEEEKVEKEEFKTAEKSRIEEPEEASLNSPGINAQREVGREALQPSMHEIRESIRRWAGGLFNRN